MNEVTPNDVKASLGALEGYPKELIPYKQWLLFDLVWNDKSSKFNKPPKKVVNGQLVGASKTNPNDMMTFEQACSLYKSGYGKGLGFCITPNDPFVCIDLDKCLSESWCIDIINYFDCASEVSVSGNGAHVFIAAVKPEGMGTKQKSFFYSQVEILGNGTFIALTGRYNGKTITNRQDRLLDFARPLIVAEKVKNLTSSTPIIAGKNANAVIERLEKDSRWGSKFKRLFSGEGLTDDDSADDLTLCNIIFAATGDNSDLIDEVFRASTRVRSKWDEQRGRETYGEMTINKAIENTSPLSLANTAQEAFKGMAIADSNCVKSIDPFDLRSMSLRGKSKMMESKMLDDKFVLDRLAILGQMTVFYAPPNAGKTLLTLYLLSQSIEIGNIQADDVFYINADDNYRGLVTKLKFAEKHGFHMLAPGFNDFETDNLISLLTAMSKNDTANGKIIILDTLKKFTDLMHKSKSTEFAKKVREFVQCGGTVICLAHVNKRADENGKLIHAGTSDIKDDSDCTYIINIMTDNGSDYRVVQFENTKQRGNVANKVCFRYSTQEGIKYFDLMDSVELMDDDKLQLANKESVANQKVKLIATVVKMINSGVVKRTDLINEVHVSLKPQYSKKEVIQTLDDFEGDNYADGFRWKLTKGDKNTHYYSVLHLEPPAFPH
jgi:hypothetical protein